MAKIILFLITCFSGCLMPYDSYYSSPGYGTRWVDSPNSRYYGRYNYQHDEKIRDLEKYISMSTQCMRIIIRDVRVVPMQGNTTILLFVVDQCIGRVIYRYLGLANNYHHFREVTRAEYEAYAPYLE